jgi:transposase
MEALLGMLIVETIAKIRRAFLVQGKSIKAICREFRVSRKVVRKVIRSNATEFQYTRENQPFPKIGPVRERLDELLSANAGKAARERLTVLRIYEEIRLLGYEGGYDAVRRYAHTWAEERTASTAQAYVPLTFDPGEAYQFDWSHEVVLINGTTVTVKVAHVRLCHSRMLFVRAYPRESQEMVFDAHDRAFAFFKGACRRGIYDNMKTAVETIFVGKERAYNRRFVQMCGHYLVDPVACTPASGWEKGQVENQVGVVRERFFTPRLRVKSYDELNGWLLDQCVAYAKAHPHPESKERTVWQVFEEERPSLVPYGTRFDSFHAVPASVSKTCLVRFDNNKYSVQASAVGRPVEVRAYAERIELRQDGRIVGEHSRSFGRDKAVFDPWHYVPVLARKPGALRNGAPFKDWVLPSGLERVRRKLAGVDDGDRQMVAILTTVLSDGLPAVEAACNEALLENVHSADVILNILARRRETVVPITIMTPDALRLRHEPTADCARYDSLRRAV